jgi:predicted ATP-grasp superfamily ATP-dependent carboligase
VIPLDAGDEERCFERLAAESDAVLVIAPEFHDLLASRCETVEALGTRLLGPGSPVVRLCGDKLRLAQFLAERGLRVVPTHLLSDGETTTDGARFPMVVKPRCGAGAINTFLVRDREELARLFRAGFDPPDLLPDIWQPYVAGRAVSVSAIIASGRCGDVFPIGEQHIRVEEAGPAETFHYTGGRIPADSVPTEAIEELVRAACAALGEGANGYVGFDIVMPSDGTPVLVEINPRLTTSYIGYRALTGDNLAERMLAAAFGRAVGEPIRWNRGPIEFAPGGTGPGDVE